MSSSSPSPKKSKKTHAASPKAPASKKNLSSKQNVEHKHKTKKEEVFVEHEKTSLFDIYAENKERIHALIFLLGIFICIYIGLSMMSYDPLSTEMHNVGGMLGNYLAEMLFSSFGYGAWSILFLGGTCAWKLAGRNVGGFSRVIGFGGLLWAFTCSLSLLFPEVLDVGYFAGGALGHQSALFLSWIIGPAGAWLSIIAWSIGLALLMVGMDIGGFTNRWIESIESNWPTMGQRSIVFVQNVLSSIRDIFVSLTSGFFSKESESDDGWEEENSRWYETDDGLAQAKTKADEDSYFDSESLASEMTQEKDPYFEEFPVSEEVELTRTRVKYGEKSASNAEPSVDPTTSQLGTQEYEAPKTAPQPKQKEKKTTYSIEESAVGLGKTKNRPVMIPPVQEDISIWYGQSENSDEHALNALLNEMDQHVSSSSTSSEFSLLSEASVVDEKPLRKEKAEKEKTKNQKQKDSYSEPPLVESMSESEVSQQIVYHDEIPSAEIEMEDKSISKHASTQHKMMESGSEESFSESSKSFSELVEEELLSEYNMSDGPIINPGHLVSGGKKEEIVISPDYKTFVLPSLELLDEHEEEVAHFDEKELRRLSVLLEERLMDFNVRGEVMAIRPGPVITTFEYKPARGIKISKISGLADDIAMALMAVRVRIVAPIPGRDVVGIEIPNKKRQVIWGLDMLGSDKFQTNEGTIPLVLGKNVEGLPVVSDLAKMPHLLVGGTTGSGKSVGINTMLLSMLYKHTPETLRLILIDPKMLEFEMYHDIPHLIHPVITDSHLASGILKWACDEMDSRYALMAKFKTRTIISFNKRLEKELLDWTPEKAKKLCSWNGRGEMPVPKTMPYIVVVIDELADLMMVAGKDVESSIIRIAQKARACGIHLIVATQRPSVDVITGMIKANMPCRISFQVRQRTDSRTILDQNGGENLLGRGDMLFLPPGISSLLRCHGPFISDDEVRTVTDFLRAQAKPSYEAKIDTEVPQTVDGEDKDDLFDLAIEYVAEMGKASTSMIQRKFRIGYNRAARLMDLLEEAGVIGPADGAKPRKVNVKPIS